MTHPAKPAESVSAELYQFLLKKLSLVSGAETLDDLDP